MAENDNPIEETVSRAKRIPGLTTNPSFFGYEVEPVAPNLVLPTIGIGGGGGELVDIEDPTREELGLDGCNEGEVKVVVVIGATTRTGCASRAEVQEYIGDSGFAVLPPDHPVAVSLFGLKEGKKLQELIEKYGEDVVRDMQNKYDAVVDFFGNIPEDPLGSLQKMIEVFVEGTTGISPDCQKQTTGTETELETWLLDCVNVNIIGAIGLPIPGALGGILAGVTLRDLKDAAGKIGTTIEDILSGDFKCGTEKEPEDCTPESLLNKMGDWVIGSVKDIFADEEDEITIESILGKLGDIFGGVLGGIIYGEFKDLINGEIEDVIGIPVLPYKPLDDCESKDLETIQAEDGSRSCGGCKDPNFVFDQDLQKCVDPNAAEPFDESQCTEQGYFEQNKDACEVAGYINCSGGENTGGQETTGGIIKGNIDDCAVIQDPQCKGPGKYDAARGGCVCPDNYENAGELEDESEDGGCGEIIQEVDDTGCAEVDCKSPRPGYTPSFNAADNAAHFKWQECCGETHCPDGSEKPASGICGEETETTETTDVTGTCRDQNSSTYGELGDCGPCNSGFDKPAGYPVCTDIRLLCDSPEYKRNNPDKCGEDVTPVEEDICSQPRPTGLVTFDLIDQQRAWDRKCGGVTGPSPCDQQDRVTNEDGSCGPCKPGFVEDPQGFDQCIKAPDECNDCSCAEYAAANPQECGETPTDTTETGGGASVGGGAGGAFSPFLAGISYTPQPVPEIMQTPQAGMLTQATTQQPSRNTQLFGQGIVQNLFKEYFV